MGWILVIVLMSASGAAGISTQRFNSEATCKKVLQWYNDNTLGYSITASCLPEEDPNAPAPVAAPEPPKDEGSRVYSLPDNKE